MVLLIVSKTCLRVLIAFLMCFGVSKSEKRSWIFLSSEKDIGSIKTTLPSTQLVLTTRIYWLLSCKLRNLGFALL